jgi:hypothetical protein
MATKYPSVHCDLIDLPAIAEIAQMLSGFSGPAAFIVARKERTWPALDQKPSALVLSKLFASIFRARPQSLASARLP